MQKSNIKIIFMGTPEFGAIILEGLIKASYKPGLVITAPDKPVGRKQIITPSPVKVIAQKYKIPIEQPDRIENCKLKIENLKPNLIIVAAYSQIIPEDILDIPRYGSLNVHPSLLPKYRGPSPIQTAILNGDKETGVTIFLMDEKMDHGKIIANCKLQIANLKITYPELLEKLAEKGAKLLVETVPKWIRGEIKPIPQDESKATYTKILKKEDGKIDWSKAAKEIEREIRAFYPWPGSFTFWQKNNSKFLRIKIIKAKVVPETDSQTHSLGKTFLYDQNEISVKCAKGFLIIEKLQIEGKKPTTSEEFLRGNRDFIGTILE